MCDFFRRSPRELAPVLLVVATGLTGCSNLEQVVDDYIPQRQEAYKSSRRLPPLEVPPDLSRSTISNSMEVPIASGTTYSEYSGAASSGQQVASARSVGVLPDFSDVRVQRSGDKRWLEVEAPPGEVWPVVRDFWVEQGFILELEDPSIGIMETDWAEKRADLGGGPISKLLSRLSSALYGAATRDKFRTRLERGSQPGLTEVYVSHRGAEEVAIPEARPNRAGEDDKVWQPRPADPELEAEILNRLMVYFGVGEEEAGQQFAKGPRRPDRATMTRGNDGGVMLSLEDDFSRAWRRTGLALDRVGFTVEDRDRSRGLYYVRYVDPDQDLGNNKGFFSKLKFWGDDEKPEQTEYLISLIGDNRATQVVVLNKEGERDTGRTADRILALLHEQLR